MQMRWRWISPLYLTCNQIGRFNSLGVFFDHRIQTIWRFFCQSDNMHDENKVKLIILNNTIIMHIKYKFQNIKKARQTHGTIWTLHLKQNWLKRTESEKTSNEKKLSSFYDLRLQKLSQKKHQNEKKLLKRLICYLIKNEFT